MTPDQFIQKWKASELTERAAAQSHFNDLCALLGEQGPTDADAKGEWYAFERGATKTTGGEGWADVWKRHHFAWEYKGKRKDLNAAFAQLQQYALALENPPLLVVCDLERFRVHTNWTNTVSKVHEFELDDLRDAGTRQILKWVLSDPEKLKPGLTRQTLTEQAAAEFAELAQRLRARGHAGETVAHFVNRLVFCMFAEDVDLLPNRMFARMLEQAAASPSDFAVLARDLFAAMTKGGRIGFERVEWFNGGLFDDDAALPLEKRDIDLVRSAAQRDWAEIDPSIFGTLFERGLDPDKRSQLGAHYTDRDKIKLIIDPTITAPLLNEWRNVKIDIADVLTKAAAAKSASAKTKAVQNAEGIYRRFLDRLRTFRVLDPACGSGNFLYLALRALKDLEHRVGIEAEAMGLHREFPRIGPEAVKGVEINPYAAELARVTVWIGEIQWMRRNGFNVSTHPILKPLDTVQCRDAILSAEGRQAEWPAAEVIIGNPPFLGGKLLRDVLGDGYVDRLFEAYKGQVPAEADLVCYWLAKAWSLVESGAVQRVGLVATNSVRGGANRIVLDRIVGRGTIFEAWDDEPWVVEGANVRVSLLCFAQAKDSLWSHLDGRPVTRIYADLTAGPIDLTEAVQLNESKGAAFMGDTKGGAFEVTGEQARLWLQLPTNPNGRPNSDVLRPWVNGMDITRRPADKWIIDFGWTMSEAEAALYEAPFAFVQGNVKPTRSKNKREAYRRNWWRHVEPRPGMWAKLRELSRYIVTPCIAKHRVFAWVDVSVCPDHALIVTAREDDTTFGILQSRFHELWALRLGTSLEDRPRYTPSTTFETFPFPEGLTPNLPHTAYETDKRAVQIAAAARRLCEFRERWLNPPDLVRRVPEDISGFPDRLLPVNEDAEAVLKNRTLTKLYNERPAWLANAHRELDEAVAAAYGWSADLSEDEVLARLFELNRARAGAEGLPLDLAPQQEPTAENEPAPALSSALPA
jgi:type II restriction/modification system DNA methylase subunit YeeA